MSRPMQALIRTKALIANAERVQLLAPNAKTIAVIKANAYGHGMIDCARALDQVVDAFALLTLAEARALREAGFAKPIVLLEGVFGPKDFVEIASLKLTPVIPSIDQMNALETSGAPAPERIFLKVDSGMHRLGLMPRDLMGVYTRLQAFCPKTEIVLMTHYAAADEPKGALQQVRVMDNLLVIHPELSLLTTSYANSAAVMAATGFGEAVPVGDWVRTGIMLYGASPLVGKSAADLGLQPVMTLQSEIISIRHLEPKDAVGYGRTFVADRPMTVGVVACGYADGYPRHAPTGTPVVVGGQATRLIGRVSMDMLSVDLTSLVGVEVGTPVELFGDQLPIDELAKHAGTISYEILTAMAARVPRVLI